jgi:hypothetical protein
LNERSNRYQQARKKEHWIHRDAQADCERDQQSCRRWFENRNQDFFRNASFVDPNIPSACWLAITATWL